MSFFGGGKLCWLVEELLRKCISHFEGEELFWKEMRSLDCARERGFVPGLFLYTYLFFFVLSSSLKCFLSFYLIS